MPDALRLLVQVNHLKAAQLVDDGGPTGLRGCAVPEQPEQDDAWLDPPETTEVIGIDEDTAESWFAGKQYCDGSDPLFRPDMAYDEAADRSEAAFARPVPEDEAFAGTHPVPHSTSACSTQRLCAAGRGGPPKRA